MKENKLAEMSMDFSVDIINLLKHLKAQHETIISNQIGRSGTSIGANIHEANYAQGKKGTNKMLTFYSWVFMIAGIIFIIYGAIYFFNPFPSNSIPLLSAGVTLITSILHNYAKLEKNSNT